MMKNESPYNIKLNKNRIEAFSDGVIAIIITIMAFSIPVPAEFTLNSLLSLLVSIGIFLVSFLVIGAQWIKHHHVFSFVDKVSQKGMWLNIFYLFLLSLIPLFTKWMISNPREVIPAIGYDVVFLASLFVRHLLHHELFEGFSHEMVDKLRKERAQNQRSNLILNFSFAAVIAAIVLSFFVPIVSIICFVGMPVTGALADSVRVK